MNKASITLLFMWLAIGSMSAQTQHLLQLGERQEIGSEVLGETRHFYVQLPDSYDPESNTRFPVAYLIDGDALLPALYAVHQLYSGGFMPEMILIGIDNSQNRTRDLTISSVDMHFGRPAKESTGKAAKFLEFLKTELIPHVEAEYPVSPYRTLIGHSYGGLFTIFALLNSPETFANYLAIDPSLDWDNERLLKTAQSNAKVENLRGRSLFMSLNGQLHNQDPNVTIDNVMEDQSFFTQFPRANIGFANMLREKAAGLDLHWKFYQQDFHGTIPLPSIMDGLIAMFSWYQMEDTYKINDFETPTATLEQIINKRAQKLEKHFGYAVPPYPSDLGEALSYMSMDMGKPKKAKMYLDHYMQYYPQEPGAYEAMANYYERKKDNAKALEYAQKAYEISGSEQHRKKVEELKK